MKRNLFSLVLCVSGLFSASATTIAHATGASLHQEKCATCHQNLVPTGDGSVLYLRSDRKVQSLRKLASQVGFCNTELRLDLFPEDEAELVKYLNQQFYKFPAP